MVVNTNYDTLHGSRLRPNASGGGLQPLRDALNRQSADTKLDIVFFFNRRRQNADRNVSLRRQSMSLLQPKGLPSFPRCLSDTFTDLRYGHCCGLSVHTSWNLCWASSERNISCSELRISNVLTLPFCGGPCLCVIINYYIWHTIIISTSLSGFNNVHGMCDCVFNLWNSNLY